MKHLPFKEILTPIAVLAFALGTPSLAQDPLLLETIKRSKEARDANASMLRTAVATGKIKYSLQSPNQEPVQILDADIQVFYEAPKFRIHLAYETWLKEQTNDGTKSAVEFKKWLPSSISEQVIIYDGKHITTVSKLRPSPTDARPESEGSVCFSFSKMGIMRGAGFPFEDPITLWSQPLQLENLDTKNTTLTPFTGGGYTGLLTKNTYRMKFFMFSDFGYDLRRVSSYRTGESQPFRDYLLHWEESNGAFYVQKFTNVVATANQNTGSTSPTLKRLSIEYSNFEANVPIDPAAFTLESVSVPAGTVFLDKRANVGGGPKKLVYTDSGLQSLDEVDTKENGL
ncbi:MAG: hypothetical protein AAF483_14055 [Planctomycetota bacterium]